MQLILSSKISFEKVMSLKLSIIPCCFWEFFSKLVIKVLFFLRKVIMQRFLCLLQIILDSLVLSFILLPMGSSPLNLFWEAFGDF